MSDPEIAEIRPDREQGFLLIADMESSTLSKFVLEELEAFKALRLHNRLVMTHCETAGPVSGTVVNSLGDAVVAKFPARDNREAALAGCLMAARDIIQTFESLAPIKTTAGRDFRLRTKLLLQSYDAFNYGRRDAGQLFADELVGADIDLAFRLATVSWRLQVLVTASFAIELMGHADTRLDSKMLLDQAHVARHSGALIAEPLIGINEHFRLGSIDYWITDAREISRLKGIAQTGKVFALTFESPESLLARGERQRLTIKVRQDRHAVILARISLAQNLNDNYIEHVVGKLRDSNDGSVLDSELTLFAAAKVFGEFDFFFRVSCIDDKSLRRFFDAIHADSFGVSHVEVRSIVADRFAVSRHYDRIFERFARRPFEIVLTWFERITERDLFGELCQILEREDAGGDRVELLEVGEVIHHTPVYAVFICEDLRDYAAFFTDHGLSPTACRSHVGHVDRPADAQLRYSLMSGIYQPRKISTQKRP